MCATSLGQSCNRLSIPRTISGAWLTIISCEQKRETMEIIRKETVKDRTNRERTNDVRQEGERLDLGSHKVHEHLLVKVR